MNAVPALALALAAVLSSPLAVAFVCTAPIAPEIPNGGKVSQDFMLAIQANVRDFIANGRQYLSCLKREETALTKNAPRQERQSIIDRYNAMVDEMETTSNDFNQTVSDYGKRLDQNQTKP